VKEALKPDSIRREGNGFRIEWADGLSSFVSFRELRKNCPCASCNDARTKPSNPFKVLSAAEVAAGDPVPVAMKPIGHYAYQITWNDGHDTGIYTLEALRQLSQK
jgi:DUF971 family protein